MEITRTREHGTEVVNSAQFPEPGKARIEACRRIVERCQYGKVDGIMIDLFTASAVVKIYDAINDQNKAKMETMPMCKMAKISLDLIR